MNFKKIFALAMVAVLLCTAVISAGATSHNIKWDDGSDRKAAVANYYLGYDAQQNCVYAINRVTYLSNVNPALRNLPGYTHVNVEMPSTTWIHWEVHYMSPTPSASNIAEFMIEYDIPAGETPALVTANFSTNIPKIYKGEDYRRNQDFSTATDVLTVSIP